MAAADVTGRFLLHFGGKVWQYALRGRGGYLGCLRLWSFSFHFSFPFRFIYLMVLMFFFFYFEGFRMYVCRGGRGKRPIPSHFYEETSVLYFLLEFVCSIVVIIIIFFLASTLPSFYIYRFMYFSPSHPVVLIFGNSRISVCSYPCHYEHPGDMCRVLEVSKQKKARVKKNIYKKKAVINFLFQIVTISFSKRCESWREISL